eukprot:3173218-Rhodomonas_salina.1
MTSLSDCRHHTRQLSKEVAEFARWARDPPSLLGEASDVNRNSILGMLRHLACASLNANHA